MPSEASSGAHETSTAYELKRLLVLRGAPMASRSNDGAGHQYTPRAPHPRTGTRTLQTPTRSFVGMVKQLPGHEPASVIDSIATAFGTHGSAYCSRDAYVRSRESCRPVASPRTSYPTLHPWQTLSRRSQSPSDSRRFPATQQA